MSDADELGPISISTQPMDLDVEEAEELETFLHSDIGFPTVDLQKIQELDRFLWEQLRKASMLPPEIRERL
jgi:hypothetical protein